MSNELVKNEYGFIENLPNTKEALVEVESARAISEVQASLVIAKKFPRDVNRAFSNIMAACDRPLLAEQAAYAYPKGGNVVTGPSIRIAEMLAQNWGNIIYGVKEISHSNGVTVAEAYAWDTETNTRQTKTFHVEHKIHTKKGPKVLTDPREIYELVANMGSRRVRACILGVIPGDIVDAAMDRCKKTLSSDSKPIADRIRLLVEAFKEFGVTIDHLEKKLGHKLDTIIEQELLTLRGIYKSLKDGVARRGDFFDFKEDDAKDATSNIEALIKGKNTTTATTTVEEFFEGVEQ